MNAKAGEKTQTDKALSDHIRNKINLKKKKKFFLRVTETAKTICIYLGAHRVCFLIKRPAGT